MNGTTLRFDGEAAIVTGAGNGLGRAHAFELAARGAAVVCNDVIATAAESTADEIVQRGGAAVAETTSVASPDGGEAIVRAAIDAFGSVEIVINNAGQLRNAAFEEMSVEDFEDVIRTHLMGAFYVTQPAYRHMKAAGYGRILFTSSSAGVFGGAWHANYAAAKAGLVGLCNVVALEGAAHGINANAILPMAQGTSMGRLSGRPPYAPEYLEEMIRAINPLARYMTVDNVAPLVVYLASRRCNVTRRIFSVGCGRVAQVFVGVSSGWYAPDLTHSTPEEVATHLDAACDLADFDTPESMLDELRFITECIPGSSPKPISAGGREPT
jgi:NAD(P)-dependent dehydrogenase (short-subunit alcohol dehydrogenase family)